MAIKFTLFPQLSTELRLEIWEMALPAPITKPLYPYESGCWTYEDVGLELDPNGEDLHVKFDTRQLGPLVIELPLYLVNREARSVAIQYIQKENLVFRRGSVQPQFVRFFDPETDTVFLKTTNVEAFAMDLTNRRFEPDLHDRFISTANPILPRLAVTSVGFESLKDELLGYFFDMAGNIDTIFVVDIESASRFTIKEIEEASTYSILELEDAPCARLIWRRSRCDWEAFGDHNALMQLKKLVTGIHDPRYSVSFYDLEIQLVRLAKPRMISRSAGRYPNAHEIMIDPWGSTLLREVARAV